MKSLNEMTASELSPLLAAGTVSTEDVARACLARIAERDPTVRVWAWIDPDQVIHAARELDKTPRKGPLHGIPVGVKDMIDTFDMPTQQNSPIYAGHWPNQDAACVATLRAQGALILGKTDTLEFAAGGRKALTRNPHDLTRTPGGSSSGSAAGVADFHVPLTLGTQTGGSTIRPGSFCGAYAMKPTWAAINREGAKIYSMTCDTIGLYSRSVADLELLCDAYGIVDDAPPRPVRLEGARIGVCRSPFWDKAEEGTHQALAQAAKRLAAAGAKVEDLELPAEFGGLGPAQLTIIAMEGKAAFLDLYRRRHELLHDEFRALVENRKKLSYADLRAAYDLAGRCRPVFDEIARGYDAIITPAAPGEAPLGLNTNGDPVFNRMWTLLHAPCVTVPGLTGPAGLPVGIQLVGPRFGDRQLLAAAAAVASVLDPALSAASAAKPRARARKAA